MELTELFCWNGCLESDAAAWGKREFCGTFGADESICLPAWFEGNGYSGIVLIEIHNETLRCLQLTETEAVLDLAVGLFTERRVTLGRAAAVAELTQSDFQMGVASALEGPSSSGKLSAVAEC